MTIDHENVTLHDVLESLHSINNTSIETPLIVQLVENPRFDIPGIEIFNGSVGLEAHDAIHALLGRGLLPKDEAFVIGFTMGSTNRMSTFEKRLFGLTAKYLYPGPYKFGDDDIKIFTKAAHLGYVSNCQPLNKVDYEKLMHLTLREAREAIGLEIDLLRAFYRLEQKMFPDSIECRRLL